MEKFLGRCTINGLVFLINVFLRTYKTPMNGEGSVVSQRGYFEFLKRVGLITEDDISVEIFQIATLEIGEVYGSEGIVFEKPEMGKGRRFNASLEVVNREDIRHGEVLEDFGSEYFVHVKKWEWVD